jgi:hypothetical protein
MWVGRLDRLGFPLRPKRRRRIDRLGGDEVAVHQVPMEVQREVVVLEDVEALGGQVDVVVVVVVVLPQSKKQNL